MGKRYQEITPELEEFIGRQHMFFVATAARDGRVNLSPKGMDSLRLLGPRRLAWLNLTGSGNETAAHLLDSDRMTMMWCAFDGDPLILRVYGRALCIHPRDGRWTEASARFPQLPGARQVVEMEIELVQTSCGMGVPLYDFAGERTALQRWAERKGPEGLRAYWDERNRVSLDGKPTGIFEE
ncbi:MAG: pyridoxamine 5'-phosphate oxidase family protein [Gammaproteobacteria bacterium]|nr:pyridoxamine 5'-phosphate oxidase family protein [Gammaproteobacteria bacterium]